MRRLAILALGLCACAAARAEQPLHHDIELRLDPEAGRIEVVDRITVSGRERLPLDLAAGLMPEGATIDGQPLDPAPAGAGWTLALPDQGEHELVLRYSGSLAAAGGQRGARPLLTAEGGFLPYGEGWLTASDEPWRTWRLRLDLPLPHKGVATGRLVAEAEEAGRYVAEFVADQPTEPPSVFTGPFVIEERVSEGIALRTYFYEDQAELAGTYLDQSARYLHGYADQIGDYPYAGFAVVAGPLPVGMGFPGLTYVARQILPMPFMQTRSLAHEILHNWWGNGVFIDARMGNWAEGLTTYQADYGLARAEGEAAAEMRLGWLRDYAALPAARDHPLTAFRSKGHDADQVIGYNKAAMLFHMLERELGKDGFDDGLRRFWQAHRFQAAGWPELQASFEAAAGQSLEVFFEQWLQRTGAPELQVETVEQEPAGDGVLLTIALRQAEPAYDLAVPVTVETEAGTERTELRMAVELGSLHVSLKAPARLVAIDQDHDLFRRLAPGEAPPILRDITLSDEALTVVATGADAEAAAAAAELAGRLLSAGGAPVAADDPGLATRPVLLVGLADALGPVRAQLGLEGVPPDLAGQGTARVWTVARGDAPPVLVVEAEDAPALAALLRPLPHYGRMSWLRFEGAQALDKGVWPTADSALVRRLPEG
jgi:hypothetical protein